MQIMLVSIATLFFAASTSSVSTDERSYHIIGLQRSVIKSSDRLAQSVTPSILSCFRDYCGIRQRCAVSYRSASGLCLTTKDWCGDVSNVLDVGDSNAGWITLVTAVAGMPAHPAALWKLDDVNRGRNVGSKGAQLDLSGTGPTWDSVGPCGEASERRYAVFSSSNRAFVNIGQVSNPTLDLRRTFSIAAWVKFNDSFTQEMQLVGGDRSQVGLTFKRSGADPKIRLRSGSNKSNTQSINWNTTQWTNIVWTFQARSTSTVVFFYIDGRTDRGFGFTFAKWESLLGNQPPTLYVGKLRVGGHFIGSVACLSIYERILSADEAHQAMSECP